MKKKLWIIFIILLIIASFGVVKYYNKDSNKKDISIESKKSEGTEPKKIKAIDFKLVDMNGKERTLSEFKGKKVFLNFWATWCGYCKTEMKDIQKLYDETKDKNIVILAVDVGESKDKVKDYIDKNNYTFTVLLDKDQQVTQEYGIQGFPTTLFIDEEGYVYSGIQGGMILETMKEHLNIQ